MTTNRIRIFHGVVKAIGVTVVALGVFGGLHVAFCATATPKRARIGTCGGTILIKRLVHVANLGVLLKNGIVNSYCNDMSAPALGRELLAEWPGLFVLYVSCLFFI